MHRIEEEHLECRRRRGEHRIEEHRERRSEGGHGPPRFSEVEVGGYAAENFPQSMLL